MDFRPGYREQSSGRLQQYLNKQTFQLQQLFLIPGMLIDIKTNIEKFVKYLMTRKKLVKQLVYFATRYKESELENEANKKSCFIAIEILCNEDEELLELFFKLEDDKEDNKEDDQISENQAVNEIQQLLFGDEPTVIDGNDRFDPQQILQYLMNYLFQSNLQSSVQNNYFSKILISMIRKSGIRFLSFIYHHQNYISKIFQNINQISLGTILIKLLSVDTQQIQIKDITWKQCLQLKMDIILKLKQKYLSNLSNPQICESIILLLQQSFQTISDRYFQFPEDLITSLNILVNKQTISQYGQKITNTCINNELGNISLMLNLIIKKYNRQVQNFKEQQERKRDKQNVKEITNTDFILKYQIEWIIDNFSKLMRIVSEEIFVKNSNINRHRFTSFMVEFVKVQRIWQGNILFHQLIPFVLAQLNVYSGVIQNDFFYIAKTLIKKCPQQTLESIKQQSYKPIINKKQIQQLNSSHNRSGLGPNLVLLLLLHSKYPLFLNNQILLQNQLDLQKIKSQHTFVLGGSQPHATKNTKWTDYQNNQPLKIFQQSTNLNKQQSPSNIMVGNKKNISLPNLRYISQKRKAQSQSISQNQQQHLQQQYIRQQKNKVIQIQQQQFIISIPNEEQTKIEQDDNVLIQQQKEQKGECVEQKSGYDDDRVEKQKQKEQQEQVKEVIEEKQKYEQLKQEGQCIQICDNVKQQRQQQQCIGQQIKQQLIKQAQLQQKDEVQQQVQNCSDQIQSKSIKQKPTFNQQDKQIILQESVQQIKEISQNNIRKQESQILQTPQRDQNNQNVRTTETKEQVEQ